MALLECTGVQQLGPLVVPVVPRCPKRGGCPVAHRAFSNKVKNSRVLVKSSDNSDGTYLQKAGRLAWLRTLTTSPQDSLFPDAYAEELAASVHVADKGQGSLTAGDSFDVLASKFVDTSVYNITNMVNLNRDQEYKQVVLVGDGMCTRFARIPWPAGTVIYLVAPGHVHERAEAILRAQGAKVPPGCLLRRVDHAFEASEASLHTSLISKGFRGDKLSVWGLQGIRAMGLSRKDLDSLFAEMANAAAFESLILGEMPSMTVDDLENFLASFGLLGTDSPLDLVAKEYGSVRQPSGGGSGFWWLDGLAEYIGREESPRLFRSTQRRVSVEEMDTYNAHVAAAEEVDEDFFGNFS